MSAFGQSIDHFEEIRISLSSITVFYGLRVLVILRGINWLDRIYNAFKRLLYDLTYG